MDDVEMELDLGEGLGPADDEINFDAPAVGFESSDGPPVAMDADPVPTKVHVRGLDEMTTKEIKAFVGEHFSEEVPAVEWIDDTSANLAFSSAEAASQALEMLAQQPAAVAVVSEGGDIGGVNPLQLRSAKGFSAKPGTELAVRLAVSTDRKKPRAADESRFYLMHPEHDPRERRRRRDDRSGSRDGMRRRRYGNDEQARRRRDDERQGFAASMYDDEDEAMSGAGATSDDERRRGGRRDRDRDTYRPGRSRSRSPTRRREENKGKELFADRPRSVPAQAANNAGKELFVARKSGTSSALAGDDSVPRENAHEREPSSDATGTGTGTRAGTELFPDRVGGSRSGGSLFSRISVPVPDGAVSDGGEGGGVSIRGAAGFSIKGASSSSAASNQNTEKKLRELFPDRASAGGKTNAPHHQRNRGKELMDRVTPAQQPPRDSDGHRRERNKADTFY